jgi:hypothetical protein
MSASPSWLNHLMPRNRLVQWSGFLQTDRKSEFQKLVGQFHLLAVWVEGAGRDIPINSAMRGVRPADAGLPAWFLPANIKR